MFLHTERPNTCLTNVAKYCENTVRRSDIKPLTKCGETLPMHVQVFLSLHMSQNWSSTPHLRLSTTVATLQHPVEKNWCHKLQYQPMLRWTTERSIFWLVANWCHKLQYQPMLRWTTAHKTTQYYVCNCRESLPGRRLWHAQITLRSGHP